MDEAVLLLVGALSGVLLAVFFNALGAKRKTDELAARLSSLEAEVRLVRRQAVPGNPPPIPAVPPLVPEPAAMPEPTMFAPDPAAMPDLNWERFMGVKLFAWIGGLAFFLGIAFFLKYSFQHNLIPPEMRAAIGFFAGVALVVGGSLLKRADSAVTSQTLCGTGLLVLYAVTFACRAYYHFAFFGLIPTLVLMTLITALAFLLAVRLDAPAVAILGIAGGFLTPVLLYTGQDNPGVLFAYVALLDFGLLAIAHRQGWGALPVLGAVGTILLQASWVGTFFARERYFEGDRIFIAMAVFAGFEGLFVASAVWASLAGKRSRALNAAAVLMALAAVASALYFICFPILASRLGIVFGYAFLLNLGFLALAFVGPAGISLAALGSMLILEYGWYFTGFQPANAASALLGFFIFYVVFSVFPFLFHKRFARITGPWAAAALAGPLHFYLANHIVHRVYAMNAPGLLPAALAIPPLLGLWIVVKRTPLDSPARNAQVSLIGGSALFFLAAIFAVQFHREWITIGWALEGAALCALFRRVPHPGLRVAGCGLLVAAFARLALNPAVLSYHARAAVPLFNWYLYAYGMVIVSLFAAARFLPPRPKDAVIDESPCLYTLGTVLGFLLLNIEIADYFCPPGTASLTFEFSGNFARDMAYSIAWALFALLLLIVGIRIKNAPVRYGGLGLLGLTLLKLFLHDLSELDQLYRIGALIVVAVIAILASFLYHRFLGSEARPG